MATAEELLATVGNEENIIVIDSDLRTMTFPASVKNIGVENDKDVHKLNFMMPRYFSEYDLSTFNIRINYLNAQGDGDMYVVTDPTVEDDAIYFSWLVGRHACLYRGAVTFIVCLKLADGEGDVAQEFNTTLASLQVLPGLETEPAILETDYDIIEQLLLTIKDTNDKIKAVLDSGMTAEELGDIAKEQKTLKARMDEFVSLPDGSTTGDAELTDIRVGADGTVYGNAGTAVRDQVGNLKSALYQGVYGGYKKYEPTYNHGWVNGSGVYNPSDTRYISDGISTDDLVEVVNNSSQIIYVDYFSAFVDFSSFTLATYVQLNAGQSTKVNKDYPTCCILSSATQPSGLEGIFCKGTSSLEYLSKAEIDYLTDSIKQSLLPTTISETLTTRQGNNWYYYVKIMKGIVVTITNNNTYQGGFHANDGVNDLNLGYITPGKSVTFIAPFDIAFFRCYQDSGSIDTTFTYNLQLDNPNHYNFTDEFSGKNETVTYTMGGAGSYAHNIYIPSETLVEFTNNGDANCTINVSDKITEINITDGCLPHTKYWFVCPLDAEKVRCYYGNGNVNFTIRLIGGNNEYVNMSSDFRDYPIAKLSSKTIKDCSESFNQLYNSNGIVDSFLFFTDPHLKSSDLTAQENFDQYIASIASFYRHTPISCVICGGDWLGNSDTVTEAVQKLADTQAVCKNYLDPYYCVVGNHDTNYQGVEQLSNITLANLWFAGNGGKNYYEFDAGNTHFYALDSGLDSDANTLKPYDVEQIKWMANRLLTNTNEYLAVVIHIIWYDAQGTLMGKLATELSTMLQAFNARGTYTIDGESFNFSNADGLFRFVIGGHIHNDADTTFGDIPVIVTTTTRKTSPTFDLCCADYGSNKFKTVRVGVGSDRSFDMPY